MNQDETNPNRAILGLFLRPIIRFCLHRSIKIQDFIVSTRLLFLDVAREELTREGAAENVNRLSLMTGVHRKFIPGLLAQTAAKADNRPNLITRIIGQWQTDRRFLTSSGKPRVLGSAGKDNEFAKLVTSVSKDINPYSALQELERIGVVIRTPRGVRLRYSLNLVRSDYEGGWKITSRDIESLFGAVEENLEMPNEPPNLHLSTEFDNIPPSKLDSVRLWLLKEGTRFHARVRKFLGNLDRDINRKLKPEAGCLRVRVGAFSHCQTSKGEQSDE